MTLLWMKFPDEVLQTAQFDAASRTRLEEIFSTKDTNSPWQQALALLKFPPTPAGTALLRWYQDCPYFNWSVMADSFSLGAVRVERQPDNSFMLQTNSGLAALLTLIKAQWKISKFLQTPPEQSAPLARSLALGLALQFFVMQLGKEAVHMSNWLAGSQTTPPRYQAIITKIQSLQLQRTALSSAWHEIFPAAAEDNADFFWPEFFWDDTPPEAVSPASHPTQETENWRGVSVCSGHCTGLAVIAASGRDLARLEALKAETNAPLILVFRNARPETTEVFALASAVLFAEGGVLSHAATIAREMNLPALTGLGPDFFAYVKANEKIWLSLDADVATVQPV
jgi:phosphohistidine swiveling domain-containing protein